MQGKFQINNDWQAYGTGLYSEDKNRFVIQGTPISNAITWGPTGDNLATVILNPSSPYYPHAAAAAAGVDGTPLNVRWRTTPLGLRDTTDTNTGYQVTGGIKGTIASRWDADVSYSYSEGKVVEHTNGGFFRYTQLLPLLNSGNYNIVGIMPQDQIDALNAASEYAADVFNGKSKTSAVNAKISGELFNMAAGPVSGAIGMDLRRENLDETPSLAFQQGDVTGYGGSAGAVSASRDVRAFYAEVNVPLLKTLELDAAIRSDHYSDFGTTNNPKVSLRFQPSQSVLLRGSYGQGFLAPSLYQLFVPPTSALSTTGLNDPLRCPVTHDNTLDCNAQFPLTFGGNPQLKPEESEQSTFGIVFEPTNELSMSADYFKIRLTDAITNGIPVTTILGDPQYYGLITRAPSDPANPSLPGRITAIQQTYINLGDTHIEGWDLEAHYKWPRMTWGRLRFDLAGTYYTRYDFENLDGTYSGNVSNALGSVVVGVIPRWKHYAAFSWDSGPWSSTLASTYQSSYIGLADGPEQRPAQGELHEPLRPAGFVDGLQEPQGHAGREEPLRHQPAGHQPAEHVPGRLRPVVLRRARALRVRAAGVRLQVTTASRITGKRGRKALSFICTRAASCPPGAQPFASARNPCAPPATRRHPNSCKCN